jgi:hypothetical protein
MLRMRSAKNTSPAGRVGEGLAVAVGVAVGVEEEIGAPSSSPQPHSRRSAARRPSP